MRTALAAALSVLCLAAAAAASFAQMPDPRQMSGIPMPAGDVPAGTIVVRVIRGELGNNVASHPVELHVGDRVLTATTDDGGRATFSNLAPGSHAHAVTVVDGERLESSHLDVGQAGIRVMLVAGVGAVAGASHAPASPGPAAAGPAVAGDVTFGGDSRIQIEFDDDRLEVFYLLEVINRSTSPVSPRAELAFDLPVEAETPTMLEGSSRQTAVRGHRVVVAGPFAPGATPVQIAFGLSGGAARRTITQALPAPWERPQVIVTQVGGVQLTSDQLPSTSVVPNEGHNFVLGTGPALAAGTALRVSLAGLPSRSRAGRWLTLVLAVGILLAGGWTAFGGRPGEAADARRTQLESRRERLLADVARLDAQVSQGSESDSRAAHRREELLSQLERVYGELDRAGVPSASD